MSFLSHYTFILISILWQESFQFELYYVGKLTNSDVSKVVRCDREDMLWQDDNSGFPLDLKGCWEGVKGEICYNVYIRKGHVVLFEKIIFGANTSVRKENDLDKYLNNINIFSDSDRVMLCEMDLYVKAPETNSTRFDQEPPQYEKLSQTEVVLISLLVLTTLLTTTICCCTRKKNREIVS